MITDLKAYQEEIEHQADILTTKRIVEIIECGRKYINICESCDYGDICYLLIKTSYKPKQLQVPKWPFYYSLPITDSDN